MAGNLKTLFRMFRIYGKMDLLWVLRDTRYFLIQVFADTVGAASAAAGIFLLSERFGGFAGMTKPEILFMLGYGTLVDGIYMLFFANSNVGEMSRIIGRGQLDHSLVQPVPLWIQFLTEGFAPASGGSVLLCGIALTAAAARGLGLRPSVPWLAALVSGVLCSCAVVFACVLIVSCLAFRAPAAAEEIAGVARDLFTTLKNYPLGWLSLPVRAVFCTAVPVGLAAWLPSLNLLGKAGPARFPFFTAAAAAVFVLLSVLTFRKGMKRYEKYGSPRYSGFGFR